MSNIDIPTVNDTARAATAFLILWFPSRGIIIFFKYRFFLFGNFINKSNFENSLNWFIFFIEKFDLGS